jgi:nicotinate dehydrogenase subunit B
MSEVCSGSFVSVWRAAILPWRSIAPIARPDPSTYSQATIARGRQLAALGDCAICHTDASGIVNANGRAIETPFGKVYGTNITPDPATGIGTWSYPAFERAMREAFIAMAGSSIQRFPIRISRR